MKTFIPDLSTPAGACLTQDNWAALGVDVASCSLASLLMKPGLQYLLTLKDLGAYFGWTKRLVLDASMLTLDAQNRFMVQSLYDGKRIYLLVDEFWELVQQLNPTMVLLPQGLAYPSALAASLAPMILFLPATGEPQQEYGMYWTTAHVARQRPLPDAPSMPCYIRDDMGAVSVPLHLTVPYYFASDRPANDAYQGWVYQSQTRVSIQAESFSLYMEPIDPHCGCPTCKQQLTGAYLHYLFQSTPLLCQRFLIMHNIFCMIAETHLRSKKMSL